MSPSASGTRDRANLAAVFKAYDVRGLVPEQVDEELAEAVGNAFVAVLGADAVVVGHDMRESSPGMARAFAAGAAAAGADVTLIGLASTDQLYFASGHLGRPGRHVHRQPQPRGVQRDQAVPRRGRARGSRDRAGRDRGAGRGGGDPRRRRAGHRRRAGPPHGVRRPPAVAGPGGRTPAPRGRRRRQRHGGAHGAGRARPGRRRGAARSTSSSTAASRTTRPTRSTPRTCATCRRRCASRAPTSGWPSTATPTAASSSTSAASWSAPARSPP